MPKDQGRSRLGFKLIALDVDGTIRSIERPLSDRTRETIERVKRTGAVVTLATGRTFLSALTASRDLDLTDPIATFQGAHVALPKTGEVLWHVPLTDTMVRETLEALGGWSGLDVAGYLGDEVIVLKLSDWARAYGERTGVVVRAVDVDTFTERPLTRIVLRGAEREIERLEKSLKERFDGEMNVNRSLPYYCEILHPAAGKDKALSWLCAHFGIRREQTLAFGNGYNDVQMLEWAGMSVAVEGAVPQVLEVVDEVAPTMEEDGVAQVLERLLGEGRIG